VYVKRSVSGLQMFLIKAGRNVNNTTYSTA